MRPRGEIRQAIAAAAEQGPGTWRDFAERARVGYEAAQRTVENMARAGQLVPAGTAKRAHSNHWMCLYEARVPEGDDVPQPWGGIEALADAVASWSDL